MARNSKDNTDFDICKIKIEQLLKEFNCEIISADEYTSVLIRDKDTKEIDRLKGN